MWFQFHHLLAPKSLVFSFTNIKSHYRNMSVVNPLRWGILGGGNISHSFLDSFKDLARSDHLPVAVACRKLQDAQKFADTHGISKSYGSYTDLYKDPDVDIIYIGTVNAFHFEQAKEAILHGKHVLCEKPLCITGKQAKILVRTARENNRFLMEGFCTRFYPAFGHFVKEIRAGKIGQVRQLLMYHGRPFANLDRFRIRELGGGYLMNHGVYGIQIATRILGRPDKVVASGILSETGVDLNVVVNMIYEDATASAVTVGNSLVDMKNDITVTGTLGFLKLPYPFWVPTAVESSLTGTTEFPLPPTKGNVDRLATRFSFEAEEVRRCIQQGLLESPEMPLDESILVYEICDEIRRQLKVHFPQDDD